MIHIGYKPFFAISNNTLLQGGYFHPQYPYIVPMTMALINLCTPLEYCIMGYRRKGLLIQHIEGFTPLKRFP